MTDQLLCIILAAGKGIRMRSALPKVLHRLAGQSLLGHVLKAAQSAGASHTAVVVGPGQDQVGAEAQRIVPGCEVFVQSEQRGTADAVLAALPAIQRHRGDVVVVFADTPFLQSQTIGALRTKLASGCHVAVVGFEARDPTGYGRLLTDAAGQLTAIREHSEATPDERQATLCNGGVMGFRSATLPDLLGAVRPDPAKGEFYLTEIIALARGRGLSTGYIGGSEDDVLGINSREQLAAAEQLWQQRRRLEAMQGGATLIAPDTVWFSVDTVVGRDVLIEPNVFFGPGVTIGDRVEIRANCHIEGAIVAAGARIGPFARLRPGASLGPDVHVGNFVEVKNASLESGAKANHLAYIGDGRVGANANIGAGTIFCNYDGFRKHHTDVGAGAFIGSNASLVAPVRIGDGAFVGSGSVITRDVPADALALERSSQEERPGWAAKFRQMMQRRRREAPSGRQT